MAPAGAAFTEGGESSHVTTWVTVVNKDNAALLLVGPTFQFAVLMRRPFQSVEDQVRLWEGDPGRS